MFEDTLIESQGKIKTRRGWTTLVSFALEAIAIGIMVLIPLLFTQALPTEKLVSTLVAPPPPPPPPPPPSSAKETPSEPKPVTHEVNPDALRVPTKIPKKVEMTQDQGSVAAPSVAGVVGGTPGGVAGGQIGGVIGGVLGSVPASIPKAPPSQRVRVSQGVVAGLLVHQVKPEYPPAAKAGRVEGVVTLHAIIGKDGTVKQVQVLGGPPILAQSAQSAVKQWRYKPYVLNGQPVEVDTNITVNFKLAAS